MRDEAVRSDSVASTWLVFGFLAVMIVGVHVAERVLLREAFNQRRIEHKLLPERVQDVVSKEFSSRKDEHDEMTRMIKEIHASQDSPLESPARLD